MSDEKKQLEQLANREYKYGFVTDIEADAVPKGLNEDIIRLISDKKNEPEFILFPELFESPHRHSRVLDNIFTSC